MARPKHWRDRAAAALAARHLPTLAPEGPALIMADGRNEVEEALRSAGMDVRRWFRRAHGMRTATEWPQGGPYGTVALRLPRAKDELEMLAHAAASVLTPGGRLFVYGARDEGAGSAGARLETAFGGVASLATGGRCRLLEATDRRPETGLRASLEDWATVSSPPATELAGRPWTSYPGVFAHGRLDDATELLLAVMPRLDEGSAVLDFGCGDGVIGAVVRARVPGVRVDLLDVDAVALAAARRNVPGGRCLLGDGWAGVGEARYDSVVSNPPFHRGKAETMTVLRHLVRGAPARLAGGGRLILVAQRRLPVTPELESAFGTVEALGDRGPFRVWQARP